MRPHYNSRFNPSPLFSVDLSQEAVYNVILNTQHTDVGGKRMLLKLTIFLTAIPLGFLVCSLFNMHRPGISATHMRVIIEALIFILIPAVGILLSSENRYKNSRRDLFPAITINRRYT
jgi:hypothetical protein